MPSTESYKQQKAGRTRLLVHVTPMLTNFLEHVYSAGATQTNHMS